MWQEYQHFQGVGGFDQVTDEEIEASQASDSDISDIDTANGFDSTISDDVGTSSSNNEYD